MNFLRKIVLWLMNNWGFVGLPEEKNWTYSYENEEEQWGTKPKGEK